MERWRDIEGFEGLYQVSDQGRVMSLRKARPMKLRHDRDGYLLVNLVLEKNTCKTCRVHRLVLEAFVGLAPADRPLGDHRNGTRDDNVRSNLRWANRLTNQFLNRHAPAKGSSGVVGVCHRPNKKNPWQAYVARRGAWKSLGHFATCEDAAEARRRYLKEFKRG